MIFSFDGQEKDPLRKRSVRLNRRTAIMVYYYEQDHPDMNFSKFVSRLITESIGAKYGANRGLPKKLLKRFGHRLTI